VIGKMSFNDDFEEAVRDLDVFSSKFVKIVENELDRLLKNMETGRIWNGVVRDGEELGTGEGTVDNRFGLGEPLDPVEPVRTRPKPKKPFDVPQKALKAMTEALADVFNKEDTVEVYVELPAMEKSDLQVRARGGSVEVRAKNFRKVIELPTREIVGQAASSEYKNGVLRIVIPKKLRIRPKDAERMRKM
jgi:HSP20 family molecular chaperone IbpA